jgi:FtsH-binding integral membrane protein
MSNNPYQPSQVEYQRDVIAEMANADARTTFIKKTYLHLLGAILACVAIDAILLTFFDEQLAPMVAWVTQGWHWLAFLGGFMLVSYIADRWAHSGTSRQMQYLGLGVYVVAEALMLIPLLWIAEHYSGAEVIQAAGIITGIVFGGLTVVVLLTKTDFSFLRWALVAGSFVALGLIVASIFIGGLTLGIWFSVAMVVLAAGMILYTTSNVLHHYQTSQYVAASLALFASVALLFWYILQIFMHMDE